MNKLLTIATITLTLWIGYELFVKPPKRFRLAYDSDTGETERYEIDQFGNEVPGTRESI